MKRDKVVILGSTGSIGTQSIDVINSVGDKDIIGLACNGDIEKLYKQVIETGAKYVCIFDVDKAMEFANKFSLDKGKCLKCNNKKVELVNKYGEIELEVELKDKKSLKVGLSVCENVISESGAYFRIRDYSWWDLEMPTDEEMQNGIKNLEKVNYKVDYIISHCCSTSVQAIIGAGEFEKDKE